MNRLFTSESVSDGHPDKMCDQISDALLDAFLAQDPHSRLAIETLAKTGTIILAGEVRSASNDVFSSIEEIVRKTICEIGYNHTDFCFDGNTCSVINILGKQSQDIAIGVDEAENKDIGAGDQGLMFGYATDASPDFMPLPISLAHRLMLRQKEVRTTSLKWLRPDAKSQVTLVFDDKMQVQAADTILVSTQHAPEIDQKTIREAVIEEIIKPVIPQKLITKETKFLVNPTGNFVIGGPVGDCGLTGRKIIVDTYGGWARHGGGAFSGKDPTKVDRSAAYAARHLAKNLVAAGLARECEVQLSYAIGVSQPVSVAINTFGTSSLSEQKISQIAQEVFDLSASGIINGLELKRPIYQPTSCFGHFRANTPEFPWEELNKVESIKNCL